MACYLTNLLALPELNEECGPDDDECSEDDVQLKLLLDISLKDLDDLNDDAEDTQV